MRNEFYKSCKYLSLLDQHILLISFGQFDKNFLEQTAAVVKASFGLPVNISINYEDLTKYYDPMRRQYDADKLIKYIQFEYRRTDAKAIGLFRVDLFIPILTYVIGQAVFKGSAGVVSLFRLKNELYGLPKDEQLLFERFYKEIIHELGHTFGLSHCVNPACVMRPSIYIEDVDQKEARFCMKCTGELEKEK